LACSTDFCRFSANGSAFWNRRAYVGLSDPKWGSFRVGKNLLTFSSDGTFFRSGDTHPVLSGGHGAWKLVGPNQYNASYVAFSFDQSGKWIGVNRNNLQLSLGPDGNEFKGTVKSSSRDLQDNEISTATSPLAGNRIQVQPF